MDDIPFVYQPKPEEAKVQTLVDDVEEIQDRIDRLAAEIQDILDGFVSGVSDIVASMGEDYTRWQKASQNLSDLDNNPADLQTIIRVYGGLLGQKK